MVGEAQTAKGFKMTEVGEIPVDWEIYQLANVVDNISSGSSNTSSENGNYILYGSTGQIGKKSYYDYNGKRILIARVGANAGNLYQVSGNYCVSDNTLMLSIKNAFNIDYLFNYLRNYNLNKLVFGSGQPLITGGQLKVLSIAIPPTLAEQKAIATALSDVDGYITKLEELIAKKKLIKQGAMQELLTGKRRLPGFDEKKGLKQTEVGEIPVDWLDLSFEDVLDGFSTGMTPYRAISEYYKGTIPWITSGELNYNVIKDTLEHITQDAVVKTSLKILPKGTFLIAITGLEAAGTRGSCGITGIEATTNQSCLHLLPKDNLTTIDYLFHYYVRYGNELAFKFCQGTKQQSYTGKIVRKLPINLPPTLAEQKAIAQILSDMDAELEALEQKRDKYKNIKQGMMQQLLTGRVRLV